MDADIISLVITDEVLQRMDRLAERHQTSRAGLCAATLELILSKLEAGELTIVDGLIQPVERKECPPTPNG